VPDNWRILAPSFTFRPSLRAQEASKAVAALAHRYIKPPLEALAAELNVSNPSSSALLGVQFDPDNPPRGRWLNPENTRRADSSDAVEKLGAAGGLALRCSHRARARIAYRDLLCRDRGCLFQGESWRRSAVLMSVLTLLVVSASTPLRVGEQCTCWH